MNDYEHVYEIIIKTKATFKVTVEADDSCYAIADAFENCCTWRLIDSDEYEVAVKEVQ